MKNKRLAIKIKQLENYVKNRKVTNVYYIPALNDLVTHKGPFGRFYFKWCKDYETGRKYQTLHIGEL